MKYDPYQDLFLNDWEWMEDPLVGHGSGEYCNCAYPEFENISLFRELLICKKCDKRKKPDEA